jgi:hypothetical protein
VTGRFIDLLCPWHRQYILETRVWPERHDPGTGSSCRECRITAATVPEGWFRQLPGFDAREVAAIHETGHIVAVAVLGYTPGYITLEGSGRSGSTAHYTADLPTDAVHGIGHAAVVLAGEAATRRWLVCSRADTDADLLDAVYGGKLDTEDLHTFGLSRVDVDVSLATADRLVAEHWPAVERVADMLLARGRLSGNEIADLAGMAVR